MSNITKLAALAFSVGLSASAFASTPSSNLTSDIEIKFPDIEDTYLHQIPRYEVADVARIDGDIHKDTARSILGNPHFNEFSGQKWNYVLDIRQPNTQKYVRCQLQLQFDSENKADIIAWSSEACSFKPQKKRVTPPLVAIKKTPLLVIEPKPMQKPEPQKYNLNSDFLFDFDSDVLKKSSYDKIINIASEIKADHAKIDNIKVVGHTDRLGSNSYNQKLSEGRASAVKKALIMNGFNSSIIFASGMGELSPVSDGCFELSLEKTKQCLSVDRRVSIEVSGETR